MVKPLASLSDRLDLSRSPVLLTGPQALVRLLLAQKKLDEEAGLNTAGFVSGYRGSPLGSVDTELWKAKSLLDREQVHFQPGLNEDLAATSIWGTQQIDQMGPALYDGVFAMWYGKGPGVDRSGDPFKHFNRQGTSRKGGALLVFGDDHPGKSSTVSHQSEHAFAANSIPVLYPSSVSELIEFGLMGWAISRFSGTLVAMKMVNETAESTETVSCPWPPSVHLKNPELTVHATSLDRSTEFGPLQDEIRLVRYKLPAVMQFVRYNALDRIRISPEEKRLGIICAGKAYRDVMSAFAYLELDEEQVSELGIGLYKPAMIWPLEGDSAAGFAREYSEILVVEEKQPIIESQLKELFYNADASRRPVITGKRALDDRVQLPSDVSLDPAKLALLIGNKIKALGCSNKHLESQLASIESNLSVSGKTPVASRARLPNFCSGCPHNTSTKVPQGSIALSGIGCHTMALWTERTTMLPTHMGGEGANWIGASRYVERNHVFQNLGDGTYTHSGLLAIRASHIAGVNITYKLLFNSAVAMTGGQPVEGNFSVSEIAHQIRAEGVRSIVVVSDDVQQYTRKDFPSGVKFHHRGDLAAVQQKLREVSGVSVLIYDQGCAAEKRRKRKRNSESVPANVVFINHRVCEGCGDCSVQSNCASILPLETELGRKRTIDLSSCNRDYKCLDGFCPSFVTVEAEKGVASNLKSVVLPDWPLTEPDLVNPSSVYNVLITGIGGGGIVTVSAVLAMAALIEDKGASVFDLTGLAQKGGAVSSHLRIYPESGNLNLAPKIGSGESHLILGCDPLVTFQSDVLASTRHGVTKCVLNNHFIPTFEFQRNPDLDLDPTPEVRGIQVAIGDESTFIVSGNNIVSQYLNNSIGLNFFMVGYAWQLGFIPMGRASIYKAIEQNGVAVEFNQSAFKLGRLAAQYPRRIACVDTERPLSLLESSLEAILGSRRKWLEEYQNKKYADRFSRRIEDVRLCEQRIFPGENEFTKAVAITYSRLLAYKDEYEVARLHSDGAFLQELEQRVGSLHNLKFHLAPPLFAAKDPSTGVPRKRAFGSWILPVFKVLYRFRWIRGTVFDVFGYTKERRAERELIVEFESWLDEVLTSADADSLGNARKRITAYQQIRGFGHIKSKNMAKCRESIRTLKSNYNNSV